jgi:hypothetical protein
MANSLAYFFQSRGLGLTNVARRYAQWGFILLLSVLSHFAVVGQENCNDISVKIEKELTKESNDIVRKLSRKKSSSVTSNYKIEFLLHFVTKEDLTEADINAEGCFLEYFDTEKSIKEKIVQSCIWQDNQNVTIQYETFDCEFFDVPINNDAELKYFFIVSNNGRISLNSLFVFAYFDNGIIYFKEHINVSDDTNKWKLISQEELLRIVCDL